ncbi:MAG: hypothetical protein ACHRHE_07980 [Tepidisphaerales bacterium]
MRWLIIVAAMFGWSVSLSAQDAHVHPPEAPVAAPATMPASAAAANVAISTTTEDGKRMLVATVTATATGKPVEGAKVAFFARRTFGNLSLGTEVTLDDGTAAVAFPLDLPGSNGQLQIIAQIVAPEKYAAATRETNVGGAVVVPANPDPFPRAIWAPQAPLPLIVSFVVLLGIVWSTYAFVLVQLRKIKAAKP